MKKVIENNWIEITDEIKTETGILQLQKVINFSLTEHIHHVFSTENNPDCYFEYYCKVIKKDKLINH